MFKRRGEGPAKGKLGGRFVLRKKEGFERAEQRNADRTFKKSKRCVLNEHDFDVKAKG